jgi:hypothetical protein
LTKKILIPFLEFFFIEDGACYDLRAALAEPATTNCRSGYWLNQEARANCQSESLFAETVTTNWRPGLQFLNKQQPSTVLVI